ncbi:LON peptidase N-terminal domain and RING finger protein 2 [Oncorhynchus tshawytscha]|uniref:LON peptidase N-terminal domain and RING finger protein 2 n=1 Tax=Oncorhynchus tshawytscha TaxID=74940 RepID=UPI001C3CC8AC|nr:LON peptidase N-terminal domain and RING finger protein 2 [Oncorhynchus tshawytscha]
MDVRLENHLDYFIHDNTAAAWLSPEMLSVAREAFVAGDFNLLAEIYSSQLADLRHPDRSLCLLKADALSRAGRVADALESYCTAANLDRLRPNELGSLVDCIAHTLRVKECLKECTDSDGVFEDEHSLDLFSCRLCKCLLIEPTTLECGHTFCKPCIEDDGVKECEFCRYKLNETRRQLKPICFKVNVVLRGLLDKWFCAESEARRCWLEGDRMRNERGFINALEKYNNALEKAPSMCRLLGRRAELHMEMSNFRQALQDGDAMCRLTPLSPKAHYVKALALNKAGYNEEALQEYFYCLALKPDWMSVKLETQKMLSEMFSVFKMDGLPTSSPHPHQTGPAPYLKPASLLLGSLHSTPRRWSQTPIGSRDSLSDTGAETKSSCEDSKTLASVVAALPLPPGLKRKFSDEPQGSAPPNKLPRKVLCSDESSSSQMPAAYCSERREVSPQLLDSSDMDCSVCMREVKHTHTHPVCRSSFPYVVIKTIPTPCVFSRLFYEPVTTPCGHTFCMKCLERCLDHNPNCPLCKENITEYLATRGYHKTLLMEEVLQRYLSEELAERSKVHQEEMAELSNLTQEVPIFICTMAFPTITCPLQVFEPCYRLMIRRSMEGHQNTLTGTKQASKDSCEQMANTDILHLYTLRFPDHSFADYGCMLEVKDVKFQPDGRLVVDTVGVSRFRVLSHGHRDGYNTAKIKHLEDQKVEGEELAELQKLHDCVYEQASTWFTSLKDNMKNQIVSHFGKLPVKHCDIQGSVSGPAWCWWLLAVLPLEKRAQLSILAMTTLRERLSTTRRVLSLVTRKHLPTWRPSSSAASASSSL